MPPKSQAQFTRPGDFHMTKTKNAVVCRADGRNALLLNAFQAVTRLHPRVFKGIDRVRGVLIT